MTNIKQQLISGVFYTAIARYSGIILSLVVAGVLSRLLTPDDFGTVAIVTVIISFFSIFTDMGISAAIIQNKTLTERDMSNIFSLTLWVGATLSVLFFAASWPISHFYDRPILRTLCQLLAINLFFASANIVPGALFYKNKEFKFIAIRSFIIQTSIGIISVVVALAGGGMYSLIISPILSSMLLFGISFRRYPQHVRATWGIESLRKIFSYSAYQFLFNVINYFSHNFDKLIIGKYVGLSQLGYYEKSYRLMTLPLQNIAYVITPVMHPILSDYHDNLKQLKVSYERIVRLLAFLGFPLSVFLFFTAEELILIIFGNQWLPSVSIFQVLSLTVGVQIILTSSGSIFQAAGDTRSLFICGLFSAILNVSGIMLGVFYFGTLEAVAYCISVTFTINFIQCYWQMYAVTLKQSARPFIRQLYSPLLLSIICIALLLPLSYLLQGEGLFVRGVTKGALFVVVCGVYIQATKEYDIIGKINSFKIIALRGKRN